MLEQRISAEDQSKRDIPSFIEPRPPLIQNPFMRPRPQKGTNLMERFEEDSEIDEPELVQVYLRMKPCEVKSNLYEVRSDKCLLTSLDTTTAGHGRRTQHNVNRMYTFSKIFGPQCTQKEIFEQVVKENLKKLPNGNSFTLLTYGASGSGKTYTLMGTVNAPGLVPRSLEYVFKLVDAAQTPVFKPSDTGADRLSYEHQEYELQWVKRLRQVSAPLKDKYRRMSAQLHSDLTDSNVDLSNRTKHYVWVSFLEIYNEAIYDLLAPPEKRTKLRIREDSSGKVYVKDAIQAFVRSGEEAYDVMVAGKHNLVVAATGVHAHSSRSHCIFTITMLTECEGSLRASCVRLCDLAGCERARATRNTGARMQESRAINSSLHVLERCLHTLRRKHRNSAQLVPYRESKLTRLLGSGLSGSRGEAVSMVVTLNPAPQYAHETKHVLGLAAVAQDIQINQTIFASTLETSDAPDSETTIESTAEVMRLRADNELLHFELIQAQARNKELLAAMEEKQEQAADTMRELVEEAKDMTREYYEAQIKALKSEMEDMIEEYEARLSKQSAPLPLAGTPTRYLQTKVAQLMTQIAVLEDKLAEEKLARDRAEKELEHLRSCLDERDEKAFKDSDEDNKDEVVLTDSEDDTSDPFNESLEPVFKNTLNRSHLHSEKTDGNLSNDGSKVGDLDNSSHVSDVDDCIVLEMGKHSHIKRNTFDNNCHVSDKLDDVRISFEGSKVDAHDNSSHVSEGDNSSDTVKFEDCDTTPKNSTYNANDEIDISHKKNRQDSIDINNEVNISNKNIDNIELKDQTDTTHLSNPETDESKHSSDDSMNDSKKRIARGTYFVKDSLNLYTKSIKDSMDIDKDNLVEEVSVNTDNKTNIIFYDNTDNYDKTVTKPKDSKTLVSKTSNSFFISQDNSNNSLRQFEQYEVACKDLHNNPKNSDNFIDIKFLKDKRRYFDESIKNLEADCCLDQSDSHCIIKKALEKTLFENKNIKPTFTKDENATSVKDGTNLTAVNALPEKRTYFDYLGPIPSKVVADLKSEAKNHERSPSIVKDDIDNNYEPVTVKKRIRESFCTDILVQTIQKKHESIDLFESPHLTVKTPKKIDIIDELTTKLQTQNEKCETTTKNLKEENKLTTKLDKHVENNDKLVIKNQKQDVSSTKPPNQDKENVVRSQIITTDEEEIDTLVKRPNDLTRIDDVRKSIERIVLEQKTRNEKQEVQSEVNIKQSKNTKLKLNLEPTSSVEIIEEKVTPPILIVSTEHTFNETQNTTAEFENIYKDLSKQRATEFDLLVSQEFNSISGVKDDFKEPTKIIETKIDKNEDKILNLNKSEEIKYNLRNKGPKSLFNTSDEKKTKVEFVEEILAQSGSKTDIKATKSTARSLRLRRRKNQDEDHNSQSDQNVKSDKLKDLVNLKKEFADVTMGLPAVKKEVKDIPSPEKRSDEEENLPPTMGTQSCPAKSVTRSRRKLFTPRAEPLEESLSNAGDSNERVYVPRPSYHRCRVRRKL